jgi:hypothetical protein
MKTRETPKTLFSYLFMVLDYGTIFEYTYLQYIHMLLNPYALWLNIGHVIKGIYSTMCKVITKPIIKVL